MIEGLERRSSRVSIIQFFQGTRGRDCNAGLEEVTVADSRLVVVIIFRAVAHGNQRKHLALHWRRERLQTWRKSIKRCHFVSNPNMQSSYPFGVWGTCNTPRHVPKESDSTLIQADLRAAMPARGAGGFFQTIDGT